MNLRKRINKLKEDGHDVTVKQYSLFNFDGYHAEEAVRNFWVGMCVFLVLAFFAFWWGHGIYTGNQIRSNPQTAAIQAADDKDKREHDRKQEEQRDQQYLKEKQQYIDGCKDAGKAPGDMGETKSEWSCR